MFDRTKAEKIAKEFLKEMNPTNWDGLDKKPDEFNTHICTYDIDSIYGNELDVSFDYDDGEKMWLHYCELRDKVTGDLMVPLHGYGVDSINNLTDTIMDICRDEN